MNTYTTAAVAGVPNLSQVMEVIKYARRGATPSMGLSALFSIPYEEYHQALYAAAQAFDNENSARSRTRRANLHGIELYEPEEGLGVNDYNANTHDVDTDFNTFVNANVNESNTLPPRNSKPSPKGGSKIRLFIPKETWLKMDKPQQQSWLSLPESVKREIVKKAR